MLSEPRASSIECLLLPVSRIWTIRCALLPPDQVRIRIVPSTQQTCDGSIGRSMISPYSFQGEVRRGKDQQLDQSVPVLHSLYHRARASYTHISTVLTEVPGFAKSI